MCAWVEWGGLLIGRVVAVADGGWGKALKYRVFFGIGGRSLGWVVRLVAEDVGEGWGWCRLAELS